LKTGIGQSLCRGLRVIVAQVSQQDMLARTNPARNRLADRSGPNDNDHMFHRDPQNSIITLMTSRSFIAR
jgi:hypothetical protein